MDKKKLKQKIRKLKKLELLYRYGISPDKTEKGEFSNKLEQLPLVWKEFFNIRYSFDTLERMEDEQLKQVFDEFWFRVYYQMYLEKGIGMTQEVLPPDLLSYLGLPYDADKAALKKKFHELCKKYHPDEGGDKEEFIKLMDLMEKYDLK
jgi:hypothetical protein